MRKKDRPKHFHAENSCSKCKCYIRVSSEKMNYIYCANCTGCFKGLGLTLPFKEVKVASNRNTDPDPDKPFSAATVKYGLSLHNQRSVKAAKEGWQLPTTFNSNIK